MRITEFDHIVLCVADVEASCDFYERFLGMDPREERPGKWSLHFGSSKISLQDAKSSPPLAINTVPGSGNFCLLTDMPVAQLADRLRASGVEILEGPSKRLGATGKLMSVYFRDPDENLVEVSNRV